jgi:hypothetical protein
MLRYVAAAGLVIALSACGSTATTSPTGSAAPVITETPSPTPTGGAQAGLQGAWALTFTTTGYKGPDQGGSVAYPIGTVQKIVWDFNTTCSGGTCDAYGSPDNSVTVPGETNGFSPTGVFTFTFMETMPLVQTGSGPYTGSYAGTFGCGTETVSLTVTSPAPGSGGQHPTSLEGTDTPVGSGSCPTNIEYVVMHVTGTQIDATTPGSSG